MSTTHHVQPAKRHLMPAPSGRGGEHPAEPARPAMDARPLGARVAAQAARVRRSGRALIGDVGQGTVEYVGLLLLMATLLAAIVAAASSLGGRDQIGRKVVTQIGKSIDQAGAGER